MNQKLSVLFLCGWYPSRVLPNNGDFIQRHVEAVSLKHNASVIHLITDNSLKSNFEFSFEKINNVNTHIAYIKNCKNPILKLYFFFKAFKFLLNKVGHFEIIHLNEVFPFGIFSLYLKWFQKKNFIISEHWTGYLKESNIKISRLEKITSKLVIKNASFVCPVSKYLKQNMQALGFKGNYSIVPNIVNTDLFIPKIKTDKVLKLVHISNLKDKHKNVSGMLRVAKLLSEKKTFFEWYFIGNDGNEYKEYLHSLSLKNCKINFINHLNHNKIVDFLQDATLCISFSNYETFGIVIPEAIACGTPVIATNTGIVFDLNKEKFCKSIVIGNENKLLEAILNHKNNFDNLNTKKMHNFIKQQFNRDIVANKFSKLYYKSIQH